MKENVRLWLCSNCAREKSGYAIALRDGGDADRVEILPVTLICNH